MAEDLNSLREDDVSYGCWSMIKATQHIVLDAVSVDERDRTKVAAEAVEYAALVTYS